MTNEEKARTEEFEQLREKAKEKLNTKAVEAIVKTLCIVDTHYFYALLAVFQMERMKLFNEADIKEHCEKLKNRYTADKGQYMLYSELMKTANEERMTCSEIATKLTKNADKLPMPEIIELFLTLLGIIFGKPTEKKVRENLKSRNDNDMIMLCEKESEAYIRELLLLFRFKGEEVEEYLNTAKSDGVCSCGNFKIIYVKKEAEGFTAFSLYKSCEVVL